VATTVISTYTGTEAFQQLLQRPKEALAQHIMIQRARDRISELEDDLAEARDTICQLIEGNATRWDA